MWAVARTDRPTMKSNKSELIIDSALELLKAKGDHGLTMRQVAQRCEMSLSNVQHYYKNKDELLQAMADRYFGQCIDEVRQQSVLAGQADLEQELSPMLRSFLAHGLQVSEMCRMFREYWAIATRNEAIDGYLNRYYRKLLQTLAQNLEFAAVDEVALMNAVSVVVSFVEGYSITARALPVDIDQVNRMLVGIIVAMLRGESRA